MRKVYEDQDMTMVGYYQSVLEEEGIETAVKNEYAQLSAGEVPFQQVYPELWVMEDAAYERAVDMIRMLRDASEVGDGEKVQYQRSQGMRMVQWLGAAMVGVLLLLGVLGFVQVLFE